MLPGSVSAREHVGNEVEHRVDLTLMRVDLGEVAHPLAGLDLLERLVKPKMSGGVGCGQGQLSFAHSPMPTGGRATVAPSRGGCETRGTRHTSTRTQPLPGFVVRFRRARRVMSGLIKAGLRAEPPQPRVAK